MAAEALKSESICAWIAVIDPSKPKNLRDSARSARAVSAACLRCFLPSKSFFIGNHACLETYRGTVCQSPVAVQVRACGLVEYRAMAREQARFRRKLSTPCPSNGWRFRSAAANPEALIRMPRPEVAVQWKRSHGCRRATTQQKRKGHLLQTRELGGNVKARLSKVMSIACPDRDNHRNVTWLCTLPIVELRTSPRSS